MSRRTKVPVYWVERHTHSTMTALFSAFKAAHLSFSGSILAETLNPAKQPTQLSAIYSFTDEANAPADIRYALLKDRETGVKLAKHEGNAWADVYVAYWRAVGELLSVNEYSRSGSWTRVFNAWRDLANTLIKGYTVGKFAAWTIPCLYIVGKYLRVFAIKADAEPQQDDAFDSSFQDDVVIDSGKNAKLEEASRIINRMFTLCLQDRYAVPLSIQVSLFFSDKKEPYIKMHLSLSLFSVFFSCIGLLPKNLVNGVCILPLDYRSKRSSR